MCGLTVGAGGVVVGELIITVDVSAAGAGGVAGGGAEVLFCINEDPTISATKKTVLTINTLYSVIIKQTQGRSPSLF